MKIVFNINYHTNWGESLFLCGDIAELGSGDAHNAPEMCMVSPNLWQLTLNLDYDPSDFNYWFVVKAPDRPWRLEWGKPHRYVAGSGIRSCRIFDAWHDMPVDKPFYSSAFTDGIFRREHREGPVPALAGNVCMRVQAPMILPSESLAICGEGEYLGNWDPSRALKLSDANFPTWEINIPFDHIKPPFEYKFVVLDSAGKCVGWEAMNNRIFGIAPESFDEQIVIDGTRFVNPKEYWKGAGTAIPVFSIRSEEDFGVGDFIDIMKMADWCRLTGQNILQILPVNDTTMTGTWVDSYPYKANSIFALHPMYLRLENVGRFKNSDRVAYFEAKRKKLNALPQIDYEAVNNAKLEYLHEIFYQEFPALAETPEYYDFITRNEYWLKPYAAWCFLRDEFRTPDHHSWGDFRVYDPARVDDMIRQNKDRIDFYYFVQYHLDRQLREARDYAHSCGVVLKGDIPIGISRFSVDAWTSPELFNMDTQAGCPPDDFSVLGQNWGFPTYNWDKMAEDGFKWWKDRFRKMSEYFDTYRIDHILGFFRIWQIPLDAVHGLLGYFNPALPYSPEEMRSNYDFWIDQDVMTRPMIRDWMLDDFFGPYKEEAVATFLNHSGHGTFCLKPFVDTQVKVEQYFSDKGNGEKEERLKNALLGIIEDVLFVEDPYRKGHYHPRISAQYTYQFRVLSDYAKWCFNRLYNDFYYHRHNDFWYGKAMWKLPPLLDATSMLACGEDLGMIPDCVPAVMRQLEILSLEIQRMPKDPAQEFGDTWHYPYYSVCTSSTHDMPGIRGWWESDHAMAQKYYNNVLHEHGEAPYFAEPWICGRIVDLQLQSPSMLCILPLQDWLATDGELRRNNPADEQINVPANPRHYWRYRMHLTVENLMNQHAFNNAISTRIQESHR